ncbi:hypothetical protein [Mucilaginibacter sp. dw_454]|uniref:hypothetical protein n=1 Tax=Mucilaginibacter sp. dw_454 TaxID=2720079 RepID=UPI001BD5B1BA|nr:hypothetical protein [Mucilaginibacter sp. dw_454]
MVDNSAQRPHNRTGLFLRMHYYRLAGVVAIVLVAFFASCKPDNIQTGVKQKYFDLEGYFKAETARLKKLNHLVLKTVKHDNTTETKKVHIDDWGLELSSFIQSDINKPAWRDGYGEVKGENGTVIDTALTPDLKTREIAITRNKNNTIKWIMIINYSKNMLYQTTEALAYYPDSLYTIKKTQHVRLLGTNKYFIKGALN